VKVANIGCAPSINNKDLLKTYWLKTENNMVWPNTWTNCHPDSAIAGCFFGINGMPSILPGKDTIITISWLTPKTNLYSSISNEPWAFTLVTRIEASNDTMTSPETSNLEDNIRKNRKIAARNITVIDESILVIRDFVGDDGTEPTNPSSWESPDVWCRNNFDPIDSTTHQSPISGMACYVYVRIKNFGNHDYIAKPSDKLCLYWAKKDSDIILTWDNHWSGQYPYGVYNHYPSGGKIKYSGMTYECCPLNLKADTIHAGGETIFRFPWQLPNPANYVGVSNDIGQFYLLARLETEVDSIHSEGINVFENAKNNKKIALKSINILHDEYVDLWSIDDVWDVGSEPNMSASNMWNSPDILVRNNDDDSLIHQNPIGATTNYVYIKIRNRGTLPSLGTEEVMLHWSKAATSLSWPKYWNKCYYNNTNLLLGDTVGIATIPIIQPGKDTIVKIPWDVPNPLDYDSIISQPWHFCLMSRIIGLNSDTISYPEKCPDPNDYVRWNNNVVWRNVSIISPPSSSAPGAAVAVRNEYDLSHPFCLKFISEDGSLTLCTEAEIRVKLDNVLYNAWQKGGFQGVGIQKLDNQVVLIKNANAKLCNLLLESEEMGLLNVQFNFLTREITPQTDYTFHVIQTDGITDSIIGGEVYEIRTPPRTPFHADAGGDIYAFQGDPITFSAADIGESATYKWYDQVGSLVCEGMNFPTIATDQQQYKLEITALSDGYKDYDEVWVKIVPGKIESIHPNPTDNMVTVECVFNNVASASLRITNDMGVFYVNYPLNSTNQSVVFDVSNYPPGTYTVTLFCNGQIADSKTFVKQ
jgi:hypothetical protein